MNITDLAGFGYTMGLETLAEALCDMSRHWDAFSPEEWIELIWTLDVYQPELNRRCADVLGPTECARQDAELEQFFKGAG